jgi:hypothetical protein
MIMMNNLSKADRSSNYGRKVLMMTRKALDDSALSTKTFHTRSKFRDLGGHPPSAA